jgi:hypothetical protein
VPRHTSCSRFYYRIICAHTHTLYWADSRHSPKNRASPPRHQAQALLEEPAGGACRRPPTARSFVLASLVSFPRSLVVDIRRARSTDYQLYLRQRAATRSVQCVFPPPFHFERFDYFTLYLDHLRCTITRDCDFSLSTLTQRLGGPDINTKSHADNVESCCREAVCLIK